MNTFMTDACFRTHTFQETYNQGSDFQEAETKDKEVLVSSTLARTTALDPYQGRPGGPVGAAFAVLSHRECGGGREDIAR